jgi:hypothetical protein
VACNYVLAEGGPGSYPALTFAIDESSEVRLVCGGLPPPGGRLAA